MPKTWKGMSKGKKPLWKTKVHRFVHRRMVNELLKAIKQHEDGHITLEEYEKKRDSLPLNTRDIMQGIGMDYQNRLDYGKVSGYFADNRKLLTQAMTMFVEPDNTGKSAYDKHREAGKSDNDIFYEFILAAMSYGIYPFYADRDDDNKLKPLERDSYMALLHQRLRAIGKEVATKQEQVTAIDRKIPIAGLIDKPELRDGTLFSLPSPLNCQVCGEPFDSQSDLVNHHNDEH